jgi:hypothetical protein
VGTKSATKHFAPLNSALSCHVSDGESTAQILKMSNIAHTNYKEHVQF